MDVTKNVKMAAAGTALAGALSFGFIGASGLANAKPDNPNPNPHGPGASAPANPGNGNGNGHGNGNGNQGGNGRQGGAVNGDDNDNGGDNGDDNGGTYNGGTWGGGNVNPAWVPGMPPGQNPFGPPGQVMQMTTLTLTNPLDVGNGTMLPAGTVLPTNPFAGIAPGQWGSVNLLDFVNGLDPATITWLPPGSDLTAPLPLVWNPDTNQWGVTVNGEFTPYLFPLPAPAPAPAPAG